MQRDIKFKAVLKQIFGENLNKEYKLTGDQLVIGRSPKCQIQLLTLSISRKHCVLNWVSNGWRVKDCKSQNGTYINGRQLREGEEYVLQCGDILFLGPPSELPQAFSYDELLDSDESMRNDSDDDILELPQKRACEESTQPSSKKTTLNVPFSSDWETSKTQPSPSECAIISPIKTGPSARKKRRQQKKIELIPSTSRNLTDNENFSDSAANIAGSSKSKDNPIEMNVDNVEQFPEISSTNDDEYDNSQSLLHFDPLDNFDDNVEVFKTESNEKAEKEKELELKLALLAEEVKTLQASKLELLKNYKNVCEKNKVLDKELVDKQKKMEKELQIQEVKAKNEVKSELLEKFEEDLVCNICTELFIKPTVLDCSHTFCEYCIKEWRKKKNDCPICRCKIKNTTQVRTLEQFIDKTLATLTPDQKQKRANVIAERNLAERPPPVPPGPRTARRRRVSHRYRNHRHHNITMRNPNLANNSIQVLHDSGRPQFSQTIYHLGPDGSDRPMNLVDIAAINAALGISVIFS